MEFPYLLDIHSEDGISLLNEPELKGYILTRRNHGIGAILNNKQVHYFETLDEALQYKKAHKAKNVKILDVRKHIVKNEKIDARLLYAIYKITYLPLSPAGLEFMRLGKDQSDSEKRSVGLLANFSLIAVGFIFSVYILIKRGLNNELSFTDSLLILFIIFVIFKVGMFFRQKQYRPDEKQKTHGDVA